MRIIAIINQKGGSGKTTTAVNLGAFLANKKRKILVIDLDPQSNTTIHFGLRPHEIETSIYNTLINSAPIKNIVRTSEVPNLNLVPANIELSGAEIELVNTVGRETVLRDSLDEIKDGYDYILIDCPPSLSLLTLNALTTAKEAFIPIQAEFFALEGMNKFLNTVGIVQKRLNKDLEISGVILTLYDGRKNICKDVAQKVEDFFVGKVFKTKVRDNVKLAEAPSYGQPINLYAPRSYGAQDYEALAKEVLAYEKDRVG